MDAQFWLIQIFNGVSYGALLFLLASGLTLIFGVMRIVNLAHGAYFLLGGYVALTVIRTTGSWLAALPAAALALAALDPAGRAERGPRAAAGRLRPRDEQGPRRLFRDAARALGRRGRQVALSRHLRMGR